MRTHLKVLGWLYLLSGALYLFGALLAVTTLMGTGLLAGDLGAFAFLSGLGVFLAIFLVILGLPGLILGFGLLQHRSWARPLGLILGFLNLFNFPLGTILGAYTLWALFQPEAVHILEGRLPVA